MKQFSGTQHIGTWRNHKVVIDWDDLLYYQGERRLRYRIDRFVGMFLMLLSAVSICIGIMSWNSSDVPFLTFITTPYRGAGFLSGAIFLGLYAFFLMRRRDRYDFNRESKTLATLPILSKDAVIEVDDFLASPLSVLFETGYAQKYHDFVYFFSISLLDREDIRLLLEQRMGIDTELFKKELTSLRGKNFADYAGQLALLLLDSAVSLELDDKVDVHAAVVALCRSYWRPMLNTLEVSSSDVAAFAAWIRFHALHKSYARKWKRLSGLKPVGAINRAYTSRVTPTLDRFGQDMTAQVAQEGFVLSIGKDQALRKSIEVLSSPNASAVLLIGKTGVGKSFVLKHLASQFVIEDVPISLQDKRFVLIDITSMLARSVSEQEFKRDIRRMFEDASKAGNVIIGIEDISQIFLMDPAIRGEVINLMSSAMQEYHVPLVATAAEDLHHRYGQQFASFFQLFTLLTIPEATAEITLQILADEAAALEDMYDLTIGADVLRLVSYHAPQVITDKAMPDKAIRLLVQMVIAFSEEGKSRITEADAEAFIEAQLGVSIGDMTEDETKQLLSIEDTLHQRVIGQHQAIRAISSALRRARAGLTSEKRPVATFLFYGPTGVGKTHVAKTLADVYFGKKELFTRLNMSEFQRQESVTELIGFYSGDGDFVAGRLTEPVRKRPYSLLLLDELEKAHPKILDIFLQVLDDGIVQNGRGDMIDFTHTIIIATSNAASERIAQLVQAGKNHRAIEQEVRPLLHQAYRMEFLNRFDGIILFTSLTPLELQRVARLLLQEMHERLLLQGITVHWDERTEQEIVQRGYQPEFGARAIRRTIQDTIEDTIAQLVLEKTVKRGDGVVFSGLRVERVT